MPLKFNFRGCQCHKLFIWKFYLFCHFILFTFNSQFRSSLIIRWQGDKTFLVSRHKTDREKQKINKILKLCRWNASSRRNLMFLVIGTLPGTIIASTLHHLVSGWCWKKSSISSFLCFEIFHLSITYLVGGNTPLTCIDGNNCRI